MQIRKLRKIKDFQQLQEADVANSAAGTEKGSP